MGFWPPTHTQTHTHLCKEGDGHLEHVLVFVNFVYGGYERSSFATRKECAIYEILIRSLRAVDKEGVLTKFIPRATEPDDFDTYGFFSERSDTSF